MPCVPRTRLADKPWHPAYNPRDMIAFEEKMRAGGATAIASAERFFMQTDEVHRSLRSIAARLEALGIAYAVAGGMALVAHGYRRTTVDVDILVTAAGHKAIQDRLVGAGYLPAFAGSRNLRDTQTGVRIEFLITGAFPGDGRPKPVAFPDPAEAGVEIEGIRYLKLERLIELKLASGMTNPNRLKDLADVQELIRVLRPARELGERLHNYVRVKYFELWDGLQHDAAQEGGTGAG
jgi:hypothetical protein